MKDLTAATTGFDWDSFNAVEDDFYEIGVQRQILALTNMQDNAESGQDYDEAERIGKRIDHLEHLLTRRATFDAAWAKVNTPRTSTP